MRPSHVLVGGGLDGRPGFAAVPDPNSSDGWAHARGMMQFLTTTWRAYATLGERRPTDAAPDIDHAWDAIATAARFLCNDNDTIADLRAALRRYNNSSTYVDAVLTKATEYGLGSTDPTDDTTDATNPSPG